MYDLRVTMSQMAMVCFFSLAWLVIGIFLGQRVPMVKSKRGGKSKSSRKGGSKSTELYVGNLSYDVNDKELRKTFREFGKVTGVRLIKNKYNGKSKGYAFVEMSSRSESDAAIAALHNTYMAGRRIIVNEAKSSAR